MTSTVPAAPVLAETTDLAHDLDRMAAAFTTLSRLLLAAPAQEVLDQLRDAELLSQWPGRPCAESRDGVAALLESGRAQEDAGDVRRDFVRLFVGPGPMAAPPYGSVHSSEEGLVFEDDTFAVRAAYAEFGLVAPRLNQEPDDHIGLEMAFIGELCVRGLDALDSADDAEVSRVVSAIARFLNEHLLVWGPQCLTLITTEATSSFYRGVGALGLGLLSDAGRTFRP